MSIFNVFSLFGGLALFLFGMDVMGKSLEKQAGGRLQIILEKLSSKPLRGFLLGLLVTAVIQSSSATTVMVVGFVNSGVMQLGQAINVIMGANVGTTVTAWILSLSGLQGDSWWIQMLKPANFSPVLALIGIILYMFCKSDRKKDIGSILLGFAILMTGMETMSGAVEPLSEVPAFTQLFTTFENPILGLLAGAILTGIIQSSSASVGILQALSATGAVSYGSAIPIILGQNIGTCVTAMLSSVGTTKNARRAALVHLYFNIIGATGFLIVFYLLRAIFQFQFVNLPIDAMGIAVVHTTFNLLATAFMLPFARWLEKLAYITIPDKYGDRPYTLAVQNKNQEMAAYLRNLEPEDWHNEENRAQQLAAYKMPTEMVEYLKTGPLRLEFPEQDEVQWAELYPYRDVLEVTWKREKLLSVMAQMDNYPDYLLLWNPKDKKLWYLDVEHEEFHALATWEDFIADPGKYLNRMIIGWECGS